MHEWIACQGDWQKIFAVGGVHADVMRNFSGWIQDHWRTDMRQSADPFYSTAESNGKYVNQGYIETGSSTRFRLVPSRSVPTASHLKPRAFGALACVYLGS